MSITVMIPARGGSKSIKNKNIKLLCGKPLIYWSIKAAHDTSSIDSIIVSTDDATIKETVLSFNFKRVKVFDRNPSYAQDDSTTESVIIEYLEAVQLKKEDAFILVQATSPLIKSSDLKNGLTLFQKGFDSVLSCVRTKRFYWEENGSPMNYDHTKRPRRQDFQGCLMENGAFYISSVGGILKSKLRISGSIGLCEMPAYAATEIDEIDDWYITEALMRQNNFDIQLKEES